MTTQEQIIDAFRRNHYRMTLGHILCYKWGYEARARFSELRKEGYVILCQKARRASDNLYILAEPEKTGQLKFVA